MIKRTLLLVAVWLLGLAVSILVIGGSDLTRYAALSRDPVKAAATITKTDCNSDATVRYTYAARGVAYTGIESSGDICSLISTGDQVAVYYARMKPEVSGLLDPGPTFRTAAVRTILFSALFPIIVVLIFKYGPWSSNASDDPAESKDKWARMG